MSLRNSNRSSSNNSSSRNSSRNISSRSNNNSNSSPKWRSNCSNDIREKSTGRSGGVITFDLWKKHKTAVKIAGRSRSVWFQVNGLNMETYIYMNRFHTHTHFYFYVPTATLIPLLSLLIDLICSLTPVALLSTGVLVVTVGLLKVSTHWRRFTPF